MSDKNNKKVLGKRGEDYACMFLVKRGFAIICRNYSHKVGEIDIIAEKSGRIHFIEVKSVSCETFNTPINSHFALENIHNKKISKIEKVASVYLSKNKLFNKDFQIDAITVEFLIGNSNDFDIPAKNLPLINYIPNINLQ